MFVATLMPEIQVSTRCFYFGCCGIGSLFVFRSHYTPNVCMVILRISQMTRCLFIYHNAALVDRPFSLCTFFGFVFIQKRFRCSWPILHNRCADISDIITICYSQTECNVKSSSIFFPPIVYTYTYQWHLRWIHTI